MALLQHYTRTLKKKPRASEARNYTVLKSFGSKWRQIADAFLTLTPNNVDMFKLKALAKQFNLLGNAIAIIQNSHSNIITAVNYNNYKSKGMP